MKKIGTFVEGFVTSVLTMLVILGAVLMVLFGAYTLGYSHGYEGREYILSEMAVEEEPEEELPSVMAFLGE